jgi:hypothetical protein
MPSYQEYAAMRPNKERKIKMRGIKAIHIAMLLMFTTSPAFSAQDSSVLLEKAIYAEETVGKLGDAIALYRQIINAADTNRTIAATALYRLGICYHKSGMQADAIAAFSDLARLYPEQKDLITKSLLSNLKPAPWVDGEIMRLVQNRIGSESASGAGQSYSTYGVESGEVDGKHVWSFRYLFGAGRFPTYYALTMADADTMLPIGGRDFSNQTDLEFRNTGDRIEVSNRKDSSQSPRQISIAGGVYDAWQMVPLLRRLPLREGFEITIPVFETSTGATANVKFSTVTREAVTVPAGRFDCYKVAMNSDDNMPTAQTFWISADNHAFLVKAHIDGINNFELKSIDVVGKDQFLAVNDPEVGINLSVPRQWFLSGVTHMLAGSTSGAVTSVGNILMLCAPDLDSSLSIMVSEYNPEAESVAKRVGSQIEASGRSDLPYPHQVRLQTREQVAIAGLTGERYVVDTRDPMSGESSVQYVYYLASPAKMYVVRFETGKDNFDNMMPVYESIISSLRVR